MSSSFQLWTFCCFLVFSSAFTCAAGFWPFLSDLFSPRSSATAVSRSVLLQMDLSNYMKLCKARVPDWQKHPIGFAGHLIFSRAVQKLTRDLVRYQEVQLDTVTKQHIAEEHYYESFAKDQIIRHFLEMTTLELNACSYVSKHIGLILDRARNLTVTNNTVKIPGTRPPVWKDYKAFLLYYRASVFSSVCSSLTLFVVMVRRTHLGRAFIFLFKLGTLRSLKSTSQSSSRSSTTSNQLAIGPIQRLILARPGLKASKLH